MALPTRLLVVITLAFLAIERLRPGRRLPHVTGWHLRALALNLAQLAITLGTGVLWIQIAGWPSLFALSTLEQPVLEGLLGWFLGTLVFYWWHRLRHADGFWNVFHQIHHSPARIQVLTSFYKHPLEIFTNSVLAAWLLYAVLGSSVEGAAWYNLFAATGEYLYHANYRSPRWLRYLVQTPELHAVHHQHGVHRYNYADLPVWDRLFGTYRDATDFVPRCGFEDDMEQRLGLMLRFGDVYRTGAHRRHRHEGDADDDRPWGGNGVPGDGVSANNVRDGTVNDAQGDNPGYAS